MTNPDILDLIIRCTDVEGRRITAAQVLEHKFLATDPEVLLYLMEGTSHLGMKVIFNNADKFSVNFQFDRKCADSMNFNHRYLVPYSKHGYC